MVTENNLIVTKRRVLWDLRNPMSNMDLDSTETESVSPLIQNKMCEEDPISLASGRSS